MIKMLGVDYSQGYYLGKPEPIEVVRERYGKYLEKDL
jgi:EAL domain-containing protein (putative c-di-GMP-specific phosphodiesterase class I)